MEANAALRTIVRRDSGETYRQMLTQMAKESGVETPTSTTWSLDRKRKGKKLSNKVRSGCEDRAAPRIVPVVIVAGSRSRCHCAGTASAHETPRATASSTPRRAQAQ